MTANQNGTARQSADNAVRKILETQWRRLPAVRVDSPPGAGKTGVIERLAVTSRDLLNERCMVVTVTNEQAFDLARRLTAAHHSSLFTLFTRSGLTLPADIEAISNLRIARKNIDVPRSEPCVVIGNAHKWAATDGASFDAFDLQLVDEAFQLPDHMFHQVAGLSNRYVLVGDPGQIPPVIRPEVERWKADPGGPHIASPNALVARHPDTLQLSLPVSRRLVPDTVSFIQPAFYPNLPFSALSQPGERGLRLPLAGISPVDSALDMVAAGASLLQLELPVAIAPEVDEPLVDVLVLLVERLIARGARIWDEEGERPLTALDIGIVCAHVAQVSAVRERLQGPASDVFVETADRFQGLQRSIMLVYHPLSGRIDADDFHLDGGRMCVSLSRHRVACVLVTRSGIEESLARHAPQGDRVLEQEIDREYEGWTAQLLLATTLRTEQRIMQVT